MRHTTPEQREKARQRRENMRALSKKIGAMSDTERAALAAQMVAVHTIEGRPLSPHNSCMIWMQDGGTVSIVGGYRQWRAAGRQVRKGESGYAIWIPTTQKRTPDPDDAPGLDDTHERRRFILGTVFDIKQTEEAAQEHRQAA